MLGLNIYINFCKLSFLQMQVTLKKNISLHIHFFPYFRFLFENNQIRRYRASFKVCLISIQYYIV